MPKTLQGRGRVSRCAAMTQASEDKPFLDKHEPEELERQPVATGLPASRWAWGLFAILFVTYAYFFQGGGWNQNSRFDQVRSIVEAGRLSIDDYLVYVRDDPAGGETLRRVPVPTGTPLDQVHRRANTGDLAQVDGKTFPNKPPGTTLLAVPAYFVIHRVERWLGIDPDQWRTLTLNHYLITWLSVGCISALGGVAFFCCSRRLFPDVSDEIHAAATLAVGLGTLVLPFSTMLFDHVEVAALLLALFALFLKWRDGAGSPSSGSRTRVAVLAGLTAGACIVVNYLAALVVLLLLAYWIRARPSRQELFAFALGGLPPVFLLLGYHAICFGSPSALANTFQSGMFTEEGLFLGVFGVPDPVTAWRLLFGLRRGLFLTSPILLVGAVGCLLLLRDRRYRAESLLFLGCFTLLWLINASFKEWHAGFTIGPRYLIPAVPLMALPLARVWSDRPRVVATVALVSIGLMLWVTAVDPQPPPRFADPIRQYLWPLFVDGRVQIETLPIEGPVSANPIGTYEPWYYTLFPPGSSPVRWSSFNLGEVIWPRSRLSILPLIAFLIGGWAFLVRKQVSTPGT